MSEVLLRELAEARARYGDLEARLVDAEAVIQKSAAVLCEPVDTTRVLDTHQGRALWRAGRAVEACNLLLSTSRSTVLADHDREVAARALEDAADHFQPSFPVYSDKLRVRAATYRTGEAARETV